MAAVRNPKSRKSAWEAVLASLTRRDLTRRELESRLRDKGYPLEEIGLAIEKAEKYGYVNDERLAFAVAGERLKRYSRRRVVLDLQKRGFDSRIIEKTLEAVYSERAEFEQCLALAGQWRLQEEKRLTQNTDKTEEDEGSFGARNDGNGNVVKTNAGSMKVKKTLPRELVLLQKVSQKLAQRGYPSGMVRTAMMKIGGIQEINETEGIGEIGESE